MITSLTDFLKKQEWVYSLGKREGVFLFSLSGYNGIYHCLADVLEDVQRFLFISFMGTKCPPEKIKEMAELLTRINSNLGYGNFEMNFPNGDIKFRTGFLYEGLEVTEKVIANTIFQNINSLDVSSPLLSKFMFGDISMPEVYEGLYNPISLPGPAETNQEPEPQ